MKEAGFLSASFGVPENCNHFLTPPLHFRYIPSLFLRQKIFMRVVLEKVVEGLFKVCGSASIFIILLITLFLFKLTIKNYGLALTVTYLFGK